MKKEVKLGVLVIALLICSVSIGINASAAGNKRATVSSNNVAPTYPGMNQNIYYEYNPATNNFEEKEVPGTIGTAARIENGIYTEYNDKTNTWEKR